MDAFDITASALTAQRLRLDVISSNLANVNTTRKPDGSLGAFHRKNVVFAPLYNDAMARNGMGGGMGAGSKINMADSIPMKQGSGLSIGPDGRPMLKLSATYNASEGAGVQILDITEDTKNPTKMVYDPSHPDANDKGFVEMPNINTITEMVDMISASRAYEANVTALQSAKGMGQAALEI